MKLESLRPLGAMLLLLILPACDLVDFGDDDDELELDDQIGVVEFVGVEGGCWGIRTDEALYEPINLPNELRIDGLRVEFEAALRADVASICQIGPVIDLEEIERDEGDADDG